MGHTLSFIFADVLQCAPIIASSLGRNPDQIGWLDVRRTEGANMVEIRG